MYKKISACAALSLALISGGLPNIAQADKGARLPPGAMYRYTNDAGQKVMTSILPKEAIYLGYEIIDTNGRLIETHEKALPEAEREAAKLLHQQKTQDEALKKLYASPKDALRARDRKVGAIQLKISYAKNNITQLNQRMSSEISTAANFEKTGRPVPEANQEAIAQISRQIAEQEKQIAGSEQEIEDLIAKFEPIIERLTVISAGQPSRETPTP